MSLLRGRFDDESSEGFRRYASSLEADMAMADEDLEGSLAHVEMLGETGVLEAAEVAELRGGLERIRGELRRGDWVPDDGQEDIHMAVEARLTELVGEVGGKLHTARSRNDQVATDVRLWLKRRFGDLDRALRELIDVVLDRIESDGRTLLPGYTHLQRGQPVLLGHHLLAHCWGLSRDLDRVAGAVRHTDLSPLGACALAGTPHPIDRHRTAELLGFSAVVENAMDAVSARDHLQESAAACAVCVSNLSRMAAELVLWSSTEFSLIRLSESHATGSSIMPQKRNPDGAELVRGRAGRVFGHLMSLLSLVKGLPLAYNRDLQEEREPLFDAVNQTVASVRLMAAMWREAEVLSTRFEEELVGDFSLATELADLLVERGVPFREAHHAVASAVRWCDEEGGNLTLLNDGRARRFHAAFPDDLDSWLDPRASAERKTSHGGTAPQEIDRQVAKLRALVTADE